MKLQGLIFLVTVAFGAEQIIIISADSAGRVTKDNGYGGCSLGCALSWELSATSTLRGDGTKKYGVHNLDDCDISTAWIEGSQDYGVGDSITFHFTRALWDTQGPGLATEKVPFRGFSILNGYMKSDKLWKQNSRAKRLRVFHNEKSIFDMALADSMEIQRVSCTTEWLRPDDTVRVEIIDVYPGEKYRDTAITELTPEGAH